ncbi:uncharacterized protein LAESUDRAFT_717718 [Laetiporus sulphureus 93-53]|uniref:Uncharacterized protein n=1 Tax=Laetiporus sulphureus 93-53 TaxID=1314785 RepID=A0A165BI38_9APHY|nr:uncharacterized protein LAESUDRAFT_717718 [Laetiporus sulphureus 93-53]KZT01103.1 hypothetical protein LAESUDRAFT_717718 [Laetiporus sulphureus 93-53]
MCWSMQHIVLAAKNDTPFGDYYLHALDVALTQMWGDATVDRNVELSLIREMCALIDIWINSGDKNLFWEAGSDDGSTHHYTVALTLLWNRWPPGSGTKNEVGTKVIKEDADGAVQNGSSSSVRGIKHEVDACAIRLCAGFHRSGSSLISDLKADILELSLLRCTMVGVS